MNTSARACLLISLVLTYVAGCGGSAQAPQNLGDNPFAADDDVTVQSTEPEKSSKKRRRVTRVTKSKKASSSNSSQRKPRQRPSAHLGSVHALVGERALPEPNQEDENTEEITEKTASKADVPPEKQHPLAEMLGQPVPDIDVVKLSGGSVNLNRRRSSHILVVVFWTTYHQECVKELLLLQKLLSKYDEKNVEILAINDGENSRKVHLFLSENKLKFPVGLDVDQLAADGFNIGKLPCLAIIDRENVVQSIHEGYIKTLDVDVKEDLEALLAGKDIIERSRRRLNSEISRRH